MTNESSTRADGRDAYEVLEVRADASQIVIQAAFRALASVFHPDAAGGSGRRMAEINDAYAQVRTPDRRQVYDRMRAQPAAPRPVVRAEPSRQDERVHGRSNNGAGKKGVLDFGRYAGWSIADLARRDPDYLRWLRRHSSGIRFRREIDATLPIAESSEASKPEGRRRRR
jgi:curved DNA-binding protein CbpA